MARRRKAKRGRRPGPRSLKKITIEEAIRLERVRRKEGSAEIENAPSDEQLDWRLGVISGPMRDRIIGLQAIATVFLFMMFYLNQVLNPNSFEVRQHLVYLRNMPLLLATVTGLLVGAFIGVIPIMIEAIEDHWESTFGVKYSRLRAFSVLFLIFAIITFVEGPRSVYVISVRGFIAFFYLAPMIFGMYGIWHLKGTHIITACMFSFFTIISRPKPPSDPVAVILFAISFLMFAEISASAIRQYSLASEELVPVRFQTRMVDRYLVYLGIFALLTSGLTYLALSGRELLNLVSPAWVTEAIEVNGFLGVIVPAIGIIILVLALKELWERGLITRKGRRTQDDKGRRKASLKDRLFRSDTGTEAG